MLTPLKPTGSFDAWIGNAPVPYVAPGSNALAFAFTKAIGLLPASVLLLPAESAEVTRQVYWRTDSELNARYTEVLVTHTTVYDGRQAFIAVQSRATIAGDHSYLSDTGLNTLRQWLAILNSVTATDGAFIVPGADLNTLACFYASDTPLALGGESVIASLLELNTGGTIYSTSCLLGQYDYGFLSVGQELNALGAIVKTSADVALSNKVFVTAHLFPAPMVHMLAMRAVLIPPDRTGAGNMRLGVTVYLYPPLPVLIVSATLMSQEIIVSYFNTAPTGVGTSTEPRYGDVQRPFGSVA